MARKNTCVLNGLNEDSCKQGLKVYRTFTVSKPYGTESVSLSDYILRFQKCLNGKKRPLIPVHRICWISTDSADTFCLHHRNVQLKEYKNVQYGNRDCDVKYYMSRMITVPKKKGHHTWVVWF